MQEIAVSKYITQSTFDLINSVLNSRYGGQCYGVVNSWNHPINTEGTVTAQLTDDAPAAFATTFLNGLDNPSCDASGLDITTNFGTFIVDDVHSVVVDPALETRVKVTLAVEKGTWNLDVLVFEKTDGDYDDVPSTHETIAELKEFSLPAAGSELTELNDWIA